ncbi:MAG: hypothetical protein AABZ59_05395 [Candidatus Binatota bacterium]
MLPTIIYHNFDHLLQYGEAQEMHGQPPMTSNSSLLYYQRCQRKVKSFGMVQDLMQDLPFHHNEVLFGHDSTPALLAFEIEGLDKIRIFYRRGDQTLTETAPFRPFLLLEDGAWLKDWRGEAELESLAGAGGFKCLAYFQNLR